MTNNIDLSKIDSFELIRPNAKHKIVYLHGFSSNYKVKKKLWEYYDNCSFYAVNMPGHGNSKFSSPEELSIPYYAEVIKAYFEKHDLRDVILIGHSMGGGLTSIMNHQIPERLKLSILEAPANRAILGNCKTIDLLCPKGPEDMKELFYSLYFDPEKEFRGQIDKVAADEYKQLKNHFETLKPMLSVNVLEDMSRMSDLGYQSATKPMLIIFGDTDKMVPTNESIQHISSLNKNIKFEIIKNSGHVPFYEHTNEFLDITTKFIKSVDPTFEK
ncbi:alpha/beta fold hydrolase [Mycoplasma sp. E35C]|uniref:alpha/beta fold hydrolase n=1 Tax=Mycoplasma sp. E35C TaxID=2801918 RepID=UPI001CA44F6F|nr:alpha/beta hydrolase [Mycoplasma sp. E35C]QZX49313.1 alpha/beta hydrolase [Mycoplasma sp. E35C]